MPAAPIACSSTEIAADGTRSTPAGPGWTSPRSKPGSDVDPRTYVERVWGTAAGIAPRLIHSPMPSCLATSTTAAANSRHRKSGSAPARTSRSRPSIAAPPDRQARPGQFGQPAVRRSRGSAGAIGSRRGGRHRTRRRPRRRRPAARRQSTRRRPHRSSCRRRRRGSARRGRRAYRGDRASPRKNRPGLGAGR